MLNPCEQRTDYTQKRNLSERARQTGQTGSRRAERYGIILYIYTILSNQEKRTAK